MITSGLAICGLNWYLHISTAIVQALGLDHAQLENGEVGEQVVFAVPQLRTEILLHP